MKSRPNILWIVTTQWRAQACGYAGDPNARTPFLDALAAQSVNYTQAVTPHPFGPMARAALLTGVPSPANGVRDYFDALPTGARTIAHEMRERGYATAFFGKWGVGKRNKDLPLVGEEAAKVIVPEGERGGFEFFEGFEGGFQLNQPWFHGSWLPKPIRLLGYQPYVLVDQFFDGCCLGFLAGREPWFSVVSMETPHPPYEAPAGRVEGPVAKDILLAGNVPRGGEVEIKARSELAGYYRHIRWTDDAIRALIWAADSCSGDRGCIVVFTSVHGDMHGAHGLFRKGWPQEESVRVPLLVRAPGVAARKDEAPVSLVDLAGMTCAWADGSALGSTRSTCSRISMPSVVALPHQCDRVWRGVRTRTRKLVLNDDGTPWWFFDLERDPLELNNLAGDPTRAGEMAELAARGLGGLGG